MQYQARHVRAVLKVSAETVRSWSNEFKDFLSAEANPGTGKHRTYSDGDMAVLKLVADMRDEGYSFDSIHASLHNGTRADLLMDPPEVVEMQTGAKGLILLQQQLTQVQNRLQVAQERIRELEATESENTRLKLELEFAEKDQHRLEDKIKQLEQEVRDLLREMGGEYAKGYVDGLSQLNPRDDE